MKKRFSTVILILIFLVGLSLVLYPTFSDWWNSMHQSRAIATYAEQVAELDENKYEALWAEARAYNHSLTLRENGFALTEEQAERYNQLLNVGGSGIMAYVEVPSIGVSYPIYHGTDEAALQIEEGKDLCTLVTCTPYGVNSHRMLVRGHRIENLEESKVVRVTANAVMIDARLVAPVLAAPVILLLLVALMIPRRKPRRRSTRPFDEM